MKSPCTQYSLQVFSFKLNLNGLHNKGIGQEDMRVRAREREREWNGEREIYNQMRKENRR